MGAQADPIDADADGASVDWRAIVDVAGAAVFVYQGETLQYLNQAATTLTGYEPEELIGRPFWTVLAPKDQPRARCPSVYCTAPVGCYNPGAFGTRPLLSGGGHQQRGRA